MTTAIAPTLYPVEPDILRFKLQDRFPYFHSILYNLKPVPLQGLGTFAVDARGRWYYDPEVPFDQEEQLFALYHEINHLLRGHAPRMNSREHYQWNLAGDCEINDDPPHGFKVPKGIQTPSLYELPNGELAEWYYDRIDQWEVHHRVDATAVDAGTGPCTTPGCANKDTTPKKDPKTHDILQKGCTHTPICGGIGNGPPGKGSSDEDDKESLDSDISEVEMEAIKKQVAEEIASGNDRGHVPGGLARWAHDLLNPKVDWRKILRTVARRASIIISGYTEQTYSRPSRRQIKPFILPKRIAKKVTVAFYIDTSGSIGDVEIKQAMTEVMAAVRLGHTQSYVTFVDAQLYDTTLVSSMSEVVRVKPEGGGGTDMRLCFDHIKTLKRPEPNMMVVLTDGETPWPVENTIKAQTIVVLNTMGHDASHVQAQVPSWAKVVVMNDND
jgi:predicted metal-dependent peptidase